MNGKMEMEESEEEFEEKEDDDNRMCSEKK